MLFDPLMIAREDPLAPGSAVRRWLMRLTVVALLAVGGTAALLLFVPLL